MAVAAAVEIKRRLQKRSGDLLIPHPKAATPCRVFVPTRRYGRLTVTPDDDEVSARSLNPCNPKGDRPDGIFVSLDLSAAFLSERVEVDR